MRYPGISWISRPTSKMTQSDCLISQFICRHQCHVSTVFVIGHSKDGTARIHADFFFTSDSRLMLCTLFGDMKDQVLGSDKLMSTLLTSQDAVSHPKLTKWITWYSPVSHSSDGTFSLPLFLSPPSKAIEIHIRDEIGLALMTMT